MILLASTQLERTVQGVPYILLLAVGIIIALFWLFLPVVVWGKLNDIIKLLREIRDNTEEQGTTKGKSDWRYPKG